MIGRTANLSAAWLDIADVCVAPGEARNINRVRFYLNLLLQHPELATGPVAVQPEGNRYRLLDGHHRFLAHILAGRQRIAAVIIEEQA